MTGLDRPLAVHRLAVGVQDPPEPVIRGPHQCARLRDDGAAAAPDALDGGKRHDHGLLAGETHDLAGHAPVNPCFDGQSGPDLHGVNRPGDLDHEAFYSRYPPINQGSIEFRDLFRQGLHGESPLNGASACLPDLYRPR